MEFSLDKEKIQNASGEIKIYLQIKENYQQKTYHQYYMLENDILMPSKYEKIILNLDGSSKITVLSQDLVKIFRAASDWG